MIRGFKTEAKALALEVRAEIGLKLMDPFDPYALADLYGIQIFTTSDLLPKQGASGAISGALVPNGTGAIIVENDADSLTRRKLTASHEMSHVVLEHDFPASVVDEHGCRERADDQEDEATFLSAELVLPTDAAFKLAWQGAADEVVARMFGISVRAAGWRMNASGARKVVNRTRAKRGR